MYDPATLLLFLAAALMVAVTPGPGILYVAARTLAGGRGDGMASSLGTGAGGLIHVVAGALGVSALVMASAEAFDLLKIAGAFYLLWLGIKTWREARIDTMDLAGGGDPRRAFRDGVVVEALNPKTAAFFLAFIPQFIDPAGAVAGQFIVLGSVSVVLNTGVDVMVVLLAAGSRARLAARPRLIEHLRRVSALAMLGLGAWLLLARRTPA